MSEENEEVEVEVEETEEEIENTDDGSEGTEAEDTEEKKDETPVVDPFDTEPYDWDKCTIMISYRWDPSNEVVVGVRNHNDAPIVRVFQENEVHLHEDRYGDLVALCEVYPFSAKLVSISLLPVEDGQERMAFVSLRVNEDTPITFMKTMEHLKIPQPILELLQELKHDFPNRAFKASEKRLKEENERKEKEAKAAKNKVTTPAKPVPVIKQPEMKVIKKMDKEEPKKPDKPEQNQMAMF